ncbi:MAG: Competence protein ComEA-like protein with helix-hairpin-helix repeat region [Blastococcus sp.]|nr:Competence protein ComEA-like protein with helix-hairpin-helix repeat region [Blastococcus sp.]
MRLSSRSSDDADVIRARLRALLAEGNRPGGWLPDDGPGAEPVDGASDPGAPSALADELGAESWGTPLEQPEAGTGLPEGIGRHRAPGTTVRLAPGRRGVRSLWAAGLIAALLLVGWTWLDRPRIQPVSRSSVGTAARPASPTPPTPTVGEVAETSATLVVSVVGLVKHPGLVTLTTGARVADAIAAAGGLLPDADAASVNLAAVVSDGEQVAVGVPASSSGSAGCGAGAASSGPASRLNLNTATAADLDGLPGIGPVLAQRIVDYRDQQGRFTAVDQLDDVPGIGPAIAARLVKLVTV